MKVEIGNATLYLGDCKEILQTLEVDVIVSDPPYLDGDISDCLWTMLDSTHRVVFTPGKYQKNRYLAKREPVYEYAWKCSGTKAAGGAACMHVLWEPVLAYCYPRVPLGSDLLDYPLQVDPMAEGHPWPKPLRLMEKLVDHWSTERDVVCDPFLGSGTTGVACINLSRKFIGIEISPEYFDIACNRITAAYSQQRLFA